MNRYDIILGKPAPPEPQKKEVKRQIQEEHGHYPAYIEPQPLMSVLYRTDELGENHQLSHPSLLYGESRVRVYPGDSGIQISPIGLTQTTHTAGITGPGLPRTDLPQKKSPIKSIWELIIRIFESIIGAGPLINPFKGISDDK